MSKYPTDLTIPYPEHTPESLDDMLNFIGSDCYRVDTVKDGKTTIVYDIYGISERHSPEYEAKQPLRDTLIADHTVLTKDDPDKIVVWSWGCQYVATRTAPHVYALSCLASEEWITMMTKYDLTHSKFKETKDGFLPQSHPHPLEGESVHNVLPYINKNMWALITIKDGVRKVEFNGFALHKEMGWCLNQCEPWVERASESKDNVGMAIPYAKFLNDPCMLLGYDEFTLYTKPIPGRTFIHTYHCKKLDTVDARGNQNWSISVALH